MNISFRRSCTCLLLVLLISNGCKEPYTIPDKLQQVNYLVVDGFINSRGPTLITLSRTRDVSKLGPSPELNASVSVIDENLNAYPLSDLGNGTYEIGQLTVDYNGKYQLQIITSDGKRYLSDMISPLLTPAIDSLHWELDNTGIHIYVNTHDPNNNTHYYRWGYEETWDRRAAFSSTIKYQDQQLQVRLAGDQINECWASDSSTSLLLASSNNLSQDVIYEQPIAFVPITGEQLRYMYSIIVYQYAITQDAYEYWQNLKKNTEDVGGIFDPQPFSLSGNIHCVTNPSEPVLGFIEMCTQNSKRIFIKNEELAYWYYVFPYVCSVMTITPDQVNRVLADTLLFVPLSTNLNGTVNISSVECADCRYAGASNQKPSFWP